MQIAEQGLEFAAPFLDPNNDAVLVDSYSLTTRGGTGNRFDWGLAAVTLFKVTGKNKAAAGGLTPDNVAEAIATLRPWGVDVVSGVEAAPGRKDAAKVRAFIENSRAADASAV
jgi:phosphoribosylanthranilate isomerase